MKVEDLKFDDAVIRIPRNAVKVSVDIEVYENGELGKIHADFDLEAIRDAFDTFEDTVNGDYPMFEITDKGKEYLEQLKREYGG